MRNLTKQKEVECQDGGSMCEWATKRTDGLIDSKTKQVLREVSG